MYEQLYKIAVKNGSDIVFCDNVEVVESGRKVGGRRFSNVMDAISDAPASPTDIATFIRRSYSIGTAWMHLYRKSLFDEVRFPDPNVLSEDLATVPALLSYCKRIDYVKKTLYNYLQRDNSICGQVMRQKNNPRRKEIIQAIEYSLRGNPAYSKELEYAAYWVAAMYASGAFWNLRHKFVEFVDRHRDEFESNPLIKQAIASGEIEDLLSIKPIPKKIHYCWFSGEEKTPLAKQCIQSWREHMPDWEIIEWNAENCDFSGNKFAVDAFKARKWAFVTDYVRFKVIYEHGGVYMDADMLVHKPLDCFLAYKMFLPFNTRTSVDACIFGASAGNETVKNMIDVFSEAKFDAEFNPNEILTLPQRLTPVLEKLGLKLTGYTQTLKNGTKIFSANFLMIDTLDGLCLSEHRCDGAWMSVDRRDAINYRHVMLREYFASNGAGEGGNLIEDARGMIRFYGAKRSILRLLKESLYTRIPVWLLRIYKKARKS